MYNWSTLKKLIWLYAAKLKGGASAIIETITGNLPLVLQNAIQHSIKSLTRYGLCTQAATPTSDAPADIMCNNGALKWDSVNQRVYADGTPEVLTVSENLYNPDNRRDDYYLESGGKPHITTGSSYSGPIHVVIGKRYKFVGVSGKDGSNNKRIVAYSTAQASSGTKVGDSITVPVVGIGVPYSVTIDLSDAQYANARYIRFSFNTDDTNVACIEEGSGQTASVPMLLSVGDVRDEVELIAGTYTHRCAACEYDGTQDVGDTYLSTTGGKDIGAIIVYPLATPTTEHITGQNLNANEGMNIVDSVANVSPLTADVKYVAASAQDVLSTLLGMKVTKQDISTQDAEDMIDIITGEDNK